MNKFWLLAVFFFCLQLTVAQTYRTHHVQQGETVKSIAEEYDISPSQIYKLNPDISKKGRLKAKLLVIPSNETPDGEVSSNVVRFKTYKVPPKQTLYSLAKENDITVEDLKKYNPYLYYEELGAGDLIQIPIFNQKKTVNYNKTLQKSSFNNLLHIVLPDQTKFGIAQRYGMSVEKLIEKNPGLDTLVLQPGQILKVSRPSKKSRSDKLKLIEVAPKTTFYSLTRRLGISKDSLMALNPNLKKRGLEAGMKLWIPKQNSLIGARELLDTKIIDLSKIIEDRSRKHLKIMLPFNLPQYKKDSVAKMKQVLQENRITQISLDFYSGIMMAIDSVQNLGIPISVEILDTQRNPEHVLELLKANNWSKTQAVIGPLLVNNIQIVAQYLSRKNIPVISPLSSKSLNGIDNLVQARPSKKTRQKALFTYIDSLKTGKNLILLTDEGNKKIAKKIKLNFPSIKEVQMSNGKYLTKEDLRKVLVPQQPNWVIVAADKKGLITNAMNHLVSLTTNLKIRVFTAEKNEVFDQQVSNFSLEKLNFTYATTSNSHSLDEDTRFVRQYEKKYGILPSQFASRGFDLTMDLIFRLALKKDFFKALKLQKRPTQYIENRFQYVKKPQGGFENKAVYLIRYTDNLHLKVLN